MGIFKAVCLMLVVSLLLNSGLSSMQYKSRKEIPDKYRWNVCDIFPSDDDWEKSKNEIKETFSRILKYRGKLGKSPESLLECLELSSYIDKELSKLYVYASLKSDIDIRNSRNLARKQEILQLFTEFQSLASFIEPEILKIDEKRIERFLRKEPKLGKYRFYLKNLQRQKSHRLSEKEERILALSNLVTNSPYTVFSVLSNADFPYPEIILSSGEKVKLNQAGYQKYRSVHNRVDREKVFNTFFNSLGEFNRTFGVDLDALVKTHIFYMKARGYNSSLEMALDPNNIPTGVYFKLIENVNRNLPRFHRYLEIKKKLLGLDTLKYSDLYVPAVKSIETEYDYEEAREMVLSALKPLGEEYLNTIKKAFSERWIDVYPTEGKRSGAYSNGSAYDVHPYILLNYTGLYNDVSTLAHELGHTMHSYFSNKTQPYPTASYPIFVAEVASTLNEVLLFFDQYRKATDDDVKLYLLMEFLDGMKGTLFRQTQFAEFELEMHKIAEQGGQLTGDVLSSLYEKIVKKYYGHNDGVCFVPDYIKYEWEYIPHFYYNYYVYQYATSFTASISLSKDILEGNQESIEKYIKFLSSGGSDYPINLLKKAGVDMTTDEPFNKTMEFMDWAMDEVEKIMKKNGIE